jgi:hypothetical protein
MNQEQTRDSGNVYTALAELIAIARGHKTPVRILQSVTVPSRIFHRAGYWEEISTDHVYPVWIPVFSDDGAPQKSSKYYRSWRPVMA